MKEGKHIKNKPKKFSLFHLFRDIILAGVLCVMIFICYSFVIITKAPKIDPVNIYDNIQQSSVIYNDEGRAVDSAYYTQDRKICKYEDMPENLINAFVALEDKTFWKHHGFNWTRMIGAVFQSITGSGKISGTSTITQQLLKNNVFTDWTKEEGLVRAYTQAVKEGLADAGIRTMIYGVCFTLKLAYTDVGKIQYLLANEQITIGESRYTQNVEFDLQIPKERAEEIRRKLTEATAGRIQIEQISEGYYTDISG